MSDLVKRLQGMEREEIHALAIEQSYRIEHLERELAEVSAELDKWSSNAVDLLKYAIKQQEELAAEKALADEMYRDYPYADDAYYSYCKARGL